MTSSTFFFILRLSFNEAGRFGTLLYFRNQAEESA
jgi:hypothetical protein